MRADIDKSVERYQAYETESVEQVILHLKRGHLKAGRFLGMLKCKPKKEKNKNDKK